TSSLTVPTTTPTTTARPKAITTSTTRPVPPTHWSASTDRIRLDVTADPGGASANQIVTFTITAHSERGDVLPFGFDFGDGTSEQYGDLSCDVVQPQSTTTTSIPPPTDKTWTYRHAYRVAG